MQGSPLTSMEITNMGRLQDWVQLFELHTLAQWQAQLLGTVKWRGRVERKGEKWIATNWTDMTPVSKREIVMGRGRISFGSLSNDR